QLRGSFGFDDLDVASDEEGNTAVRAGRYLSENVYTDVTVGGADGPEVSLNIDLTPNITARGSVDVGDNWLSLSTTSLPPNSSGYYLASQGTGVSSPALAQGDLCLNGAPIARFSASPFFSGAQGTASRAIDLTSIPGQGAVLLGQTWNFQAWYRDANPLVTSNFTDAVSVSF
ncbi:MAG: translocation/assembly module TamB domain-containing protein, partial [Planctomycetota bacterium]